jgi:hypothetical protein
MNRYLKLAICAFTIIVCQPAVQATDVATTATTEVVAPACVNKGCAFIKAVKATPCAIYNMVKSGVTSVTNATKNGFNSGVEKAQAVYAAHPRKLQIAAAVAVVGVSYLAYKKFAQKKNKRS